MGLVIPTGYSFNRDGTSSYLTMTAVFIVQATNTPMTLMQEVMRLGVLLLTSKNRCGCDGKRLYHAGIDRFMSEARALSNLIGNGVATLVVAKWTNELDMERLQAGLNNET